MSVAHLGIAPHDLAAIREARQVVVVGSDEAADALRRVTGRTVVARQADWRPLAGKNIVLWPDADAPGRACAEEVATILAGLSCTVRIMDVTATEFVPPEGWSAADAIDDGWGKSQLDDFMRATVRQWSPPAGREPAKLPEERPNGTASPEAPPARATPLPDVRPAAFNRPPQEAEDPAPLDPFSDPSTVARMLPTHYVVHGSEVEVARILARELADQHSGHIVKAEGKFWTFGPTAWCELPEQVLRLFVHQFDGTPAGSNGRPLKIGTRFIDGTLKELGTIRGEPGFFDDPRVAINAANGVVTVDNSGTVEIRPHDPHDKFRFTIPAEFHLHTEMTPPAGSMLHRLVHGAFEGDADADDKAHLVGEMLGAAALGLATRLPQPKAFIFLGETASNGKSTIASLLTCLLPAGSVSSIPPAAFSDERRIINLAGKAANVADELSAAAIGGETFKAAVTGNPIEGRDVYRSAVTFSPRALHCFTTNTLPRFNGGIDRGLRRRLVVLRFNRSIPRAEIIPDIADRIRRDEMDLLLGLAVAGAQRLIRNRAYTIPASSHDALTDWLLSDPLNEWLEVRTKRTDDEPAGGWSRTSALYADFKAWASENGHTDRFLLPVNTFSQRLRALEGVHIQRGSRGSFAVGIMLNGAGLAPRSDW